MNTNQPATETKSITVTKSDKPVAARIVQTPAQMSVALDKARLSTAIPSAVFQRPGRGYYRRSR